MKYVRIIIPAFFAFVLCLLIPASGLCQEPRLENATFTATGEHGTLLHIPTPGRYSIQAQSPQGTAIELVDRMAGPIASAGQSGELDGRLDLLLDEGTYKLRLYASEKGQGILTVKVFPFQEAQPVAQAEDFPQLQNLQLERGELGDLQQRSYWLYLEQRQILHLEAIGRSLKDCRLWRQEKWLVDVTPDISIYEPVTGQPMTYLEFHHDLNPGLYRITFYGGDPFEWAEDSPDSPFYLRMGIPQFGTNGQKMLTISPFGRDAFLVSGQTDFFEVTRQDKKDTLLRVTPWNQTTSRHSDGSQAQISKESRDPWGQLQLDQQTDGNRVVSIQAVPGDQVVFTYFERRETYNFPRYTSQHYWISNLSSAEARDALDVTALFVHRWSSNARAEVVKSEVPEIGRTQSLTRNINLLGDLTLFLYVRDDGTYRIDEDSHSGARARYRLEPHLFWRPEDYRSPNFAWAGTTHELTRGFHVLSISPRSKGILSFTVRHIDDAASQQVEPAIPERDVQIARQRILWPQIDLIHQRNLCLLVLNFRQDVKTGLIIRPLPLDLSDPLPVTLLPGEQVPMQVKVTTPSHLVIEAQHETTFQVSGYAEPLGAETVVAPGTYTFSLKNTGSQATLFSVKTIAAHVGPRLSKRELIQRARERDHFPVLMAENPLFREYEREERQHFTLLVEEAGLYRLETSGRLATRIIVRNHFNPALFSAEQNGIGRNALVQQYLKSGEYQVTVQTLGHSRGRAGLHLRQTPLQHEAGLSVGTQKKIRLQPDEAIRYQLEIQEPGLYRLRTLGLNKSFLWRLEDEEGWPLLRPNQQGAIERWFRSGNYYYYSLPEAVESRRLTALEPIKDEAPELQGKGPHPLQFNREIEHVWREESGRAPDLFVLDAPDPVHCTISLSEDMEAEVWFEQGEQIAWIRGGVPENLTFETPGKYEFRVTSLPESDRLPYTLHVQTDWLISSLRQTLSSLPASLTVSVGDDSLIDLFSFGGADAKATLWQGDERIAQHDDMPLDWNFNISRRLKAGTYRLEVEQVGADPLQTLEIGMIKRQERALSLQNFPLSLDMTLRNEVAQIPFVSGDKEHLARFQVAGAGAVKMAILRDDRILTEAEQEFFLPLRPKTDYTLLLWRLDDAAGAITLKADIVPAQEAALGTEQITLSPASENVTAYKLIKAEKVSYSVKSGSSFLTGLWYAPQAEHAFIPVTEVPMVLPRQSGWLLCSPAVSQQSVQIAPFVFSHQQSVTVDMDHAWLPFDITQSNDVPTLFEVESTGTVVGAMVTDQECCPAQALNWFGAQREPSKTLIAIPGSGKYRATLWPTTSEPLSSPVRISRRTFPMTQETCWQDKPEQSGELEPGKARKFVLSEYFQALNLVLSKGLVAYLWQNGRTEAFVAAVSGNIQQHITVNGGELFLLNSETQPAIYRLEQVTTATDSIYSLDPGSGFERVYSAPGTIVFRIPENPHTLFVSGDRITSRFLRDDGYIVEGTGAFSSYASGSGLLEVTYKPGYVKVWQSQAARQQAAFIGPAPDVAPEPLGAAAKPLQNAWQRWEFEVASPTYVIARAEATGVTALVSPEGEVLTTSISSQYTGRRLEYYLRPGVYQLWTRPLSNVHQQGTLVLQRIKPVELDQQPFAERLIQAGETQVYRFQVSVASTVGAGVEAESDQLQTRLFNQQFEPLAQGPLLFRRLEAGEYIFTVKLGENRVEPVRYRPVALGHHGSRQGIPPDVLEQYQIH